jgi:hypothetical protein
MALAVFAKPYFLSVTTVPRRWTRAIIRPAVQVNSVSLDSPEPLVMLMTALPPSLRALFCSLMMALAKAVSQRSCCDLLDEV